MEKKILMAVVEIFSRNFAENKSEKNYLTCFGDERKIILLIHVVQSCCLVLKEGEFSLSIDFD